MAINTLTFVDMWGCFAGKADMYLKDGLHLGGKGATGFTDYQQQSKVAWEYFW